VRIGRPVGARRRRHCWPASPRGAVAPPSLWTQQPLGGAVSSSLWTQQPLGGDGSVVIVDPAAPGGRGVVVFADPAAPGGRWHRGPSYQRFLGKQTLEEGRWLGEPRSAWLSRQSTTWARRPVAPEPRLKDAANRRSVGESFALDLVTEPLDTGGAEPEPGELLGAGVSLPVGADGLQRPALASLAMVGLTQLLRVAVPATAFEGAGALGGSTPSLALVHEDPRGLPLLEIAAVGVQSERSRADTVASPVEQPERRCPRRDVAVVQRRRSGVAVVLYSGRGG